MRRYFDLSFEKPVSFEIKIDKKNSQIFIEQEGRIFGEQPYFCFKDFSGNYYHEPLYKIGLSTWAYYVNFPFNNLDKIGVAANNPYGITTVQSMELKSKKQKKNILEN